MYGDSIDVGGTVFNPSSSGSRSLFGGPLSQLNVICSGMANVDVTTCAGKAGGRCPRCCFHLQLSEDAGLTSSWDENSEITH